MWETWSDGNISLKFEWDGGSTIIGTAPTRAFSSLEESKRERGRRRKWDRGHFFGRDKRSGWLLACIARRLT